MKAASPWLSIGQNLEIIDLDKALACHHQMSPPTRALLQQSADAGSQWSSEARSLLIATVCVIGASRSGTRFKASLTHFRPSLPVTRGPLLADENQRLPDAKSPTTTG